MKSSDRKYVSRKQIQQLELGNAVILNMSQLTDLARHAPTWVRINSVSDAAGYYLTTIQDTRNEPTNGITRLS